MLKRKTTLSLFLRSVILPAYKVSVVTHSGKIVSGFITAIISASRLAFGALLVSTLLASINSAWAQSIEVASAKDIVVTPAGTQVDGASPTDVIYTCTHNNLIRRIELSYPQTSPLPCVVNYYKYDEAPGQVQTLWQATKTQGFCEKKASNLYQQLQDWGWQCSANP